MKVLRIQNGQFVDEKNRKILLRGIAINGENNKTSANAFAIEYPFKDDIRHDLHKLSHWGFNLLRLPVYWQAIEPIRPGKTDMSYILSVEKIVREAEKEGFYIQIVFPLQEWFNFSGINETSNWVLESIGIDTKTLHGTNSISHWQRQLARKTMFTAFFGGNLFFPETIKDGKNIQFWLQNHFIHAVSTITDRLKKYKQVIGYDFLSGYNEGFIGSPRLDEYHDTDFGLAQTPTPFQLIFLGNGGGANVNLSIMYGTHGFTIWKKYLSTNNTSIWQKGQDCIYRKHKIWGIDPNGAPMLLQPEYFFRRGQQRFHFHTDFLLPFLERINFILGKRHSFLIFYEEHPDKKNSHKAGEKQPPFIPSIRYRDLLLDHTGHFFKSIFIHPFTKNIIFGKNKIRTEIHLMLKKIKKHYSFRTSSPLLISNTGIHYKLKYSKTLKERNQIHTDALDRLLIPLETEFLNYVLHEYSSTEDSIALPALEHIPNSRGEKAFSRPYPVRNNGTLVFAHFDINKSLYKISIRQETEILECELFIPKVHYPTGFLIQVNAGSWTWNARKNLVSFKGEKGKSLYGITVLPAKK